MKWNILACGATVAVSALFLVGCASPGVKSEAERKTVASASAAALDAFKNEDPSLAPLLDKAIGYAIIPDVSKAGFLAGGSYGKGEVFEHGKKIGHTDITQATFGLQAGAQTYDELLVFTQQENMNDFKGSEFKLSGNASAVAVKAGAAGTVDPAKGVHAFCRTKGGLMAEASVGGQRFRFIPIVPGE